MLKHVAGALGTFPSQAVCSVKQWRSRAHDFDLYLNITHASIFYYRLSSSLFFSWACSCRLQWRLGYNPDKLPVYGRKENNHSLLQLTQSSRLTSRACLWKPERNQADRWRTRQPHTHHKEKLPDLVDQTCDTRVAPLEHQSLFKVFLPNLNRTREAHLRQVHSHTKRNIQQTLPHSQFHLLLCDAETKRKKKNHNTTHTHATFCMYLSRSWE